jgi:hypothetical protein
LIKILKCYLPSKFRENSQNFDYILNNDCERARSFVEMKQPQKVTIRHVLPPKNKRGSTKFGVLSQFGTKDSACNFDTTTKHKKRSP